jgi:hypothetical protein
MFGQRGLADPRLPRHQNQAPSTADCFFEPEPFGYQRLTIVLAL